MIERQYGVATTVTLPVIKAAVRDYAVAADWTPATGDVKVRLSGGNFANVTTLPGIAGGSGAAMWVFTLTAAEMAAPRIQVQVVDAATKAVEDQSFIVETYGHPLATDPRGVVASDTAQGGAAQSITLAAAASSVDGFHGGDFLTIRSGTGAGGWGQGVTYTGASRVLVMDRPWTKGIPDATSVYDIVPGTLASTLLEIATQVLSSATSTPIAANVEEINTVTITGDGSATPFGV